MFKTQFNSREICTSEVGTPDKIIRAGKLNKNGSIEVIEKGREDFYTYIQSFADSCDINVLLARFTHGDKDALNQVQGHYIDVTGLPKTYGEALEMVTNANDMFVNLPADVKESYNNNLYEFVNDIGSDHFMELFNPKTESVAPVESVSKDIVNESIAG